LPEVLELFKRHGVTAQEGIPYEGSKPCYILDVENNDFAVDVTRLLARILPLPKPKSTKPKKKA